MTDWVFETRDLKAVPCKRYGFNLTQDEKDAADIWKNIKYGKNIVEKTCSFCLPQKTHFSG